MAILGVVDSGNGKGRRKIQTASEKLRNGMAISKGKLEAKRHPKLNEKKGDSK